MPSELCDAVPAFATPLPHFSLQCGSSWEVDLRSDADCNTPGLERCHPRYTLGWRHREVQLWRPGLPLPKAEHAKWPEYIHAYCDVWHRGRIEQVVAAPVEREDVRERARRQRTSSSGSTSSQARTRPSCTPLKKRARVKRIVLRIYMVSANSSRPISMRRISLVPAPISYSLASRQSRPRG